MHLLDSVSAKEELKLLRESRKKKSSVAKSNSLCPKVDRSADQSQIRCSSSETFSGYICRGAVIYFFGFPLIGSGFWIDPHFFWICRSDAIRSKTG
jgi:hypothetical protein